MIAVMLHEFRRLFKSFRSMLIILLFAWISGVTSQFILRNPQFLRQRTVEMSYVLGLTFFVYLFGTLLVFIISHDTISREVDSGTIRLIVTKESRANIVMGKFVGIALFWVCCITICYFIISIMTNQIIIYNYFNIISLFIYSSAVCVFISTIFMKPSITGFFSIIVGISFPATDFMLTYMPKYSKSFWFYAKHLTPQHYLVNDRSFAFLLVIFALIVVYLSVQVFEGSDI